jgi:hypothetical protein
MIWPAIAALDDLPIEPGFLDLGADCRRADCLDGRDRGCADAVDRRDTGTDGDAVEMHRAGAAERHTAAELSAGHAQHVAQRPEERRVAVNIEAVRVTVDLNREGHGYLGSVFKIRTTAKCPRSAMKAHL